MEPDLLKQKIQGILGREIKFEGHFEKVASSMEDNLVNSILGWVQDCKDDKAYFKQSRSYSHLLIFVFRPNDTRYRVILTKEKNYYFLAFFLDKHKYYERELERLGF